MATESLRDRRATINEATENVVHQLQGCPTDLVQLVEAVRRRPLRIVVIPAETIILWRSEEPSSWSLVLEWLTTMDVEINVS
jgi:hypothetical protein